MRAIAVSLALTLLATVAVGQGSPSASSQHAIIVPADQVKYGPAPDVLPPGAELAVLEGKPTEAGPFTMRLRMPDGYKIPPHYHPATEHVTVLQGTFKVGMGDKFDPSTMTPLATGTFGALAPGTRHFAQAQGKTVLQLHGVGPWKLVYVNPADDPRNKTP
jgi:quercetin dioxygenase-like cupin family protein